MSEQQTSVRSTALAPFDIDATSAAARTAILNAVRTSGAGAPDPEIPRTYQRSGGDTPRPQVVDLFAERVADYKATVRRIPEAQLANEIGKALAEITASSVVVPHDLPAEWLSTVHGEVLRDDPSAPFSNSRLNEISAVVTASRVGVAVPGTIVLDSGEYQGRRALSLVPDAHVCVVREDDIVMTLPEAMDRLGRTTTPMTWISGPSATSDIELQRVEGVHGPRTLIVLIVS